MAFYAKVSTPRIVRVLDAMPNYSDYAEERRATESETSYRLALGQVLKAWGDQLLDLAEQQPRALSRAQTRMVDTLLEGISEVFHTLNEMEELHSWGNRPAPHELLESDARLLELLERAQRIVLELRQREFSGVWIEKHAKPLYKTFRRMEKVLASRNDILGKLPPPAGSGPVEPAPVTGSLL